MTTRKRNPWHGQNATKEFLYDVRHPGAFFMDGLDGLRGRNGIDPGTRVVGICMVALGCGQAVVGTVALLIGYGVL